MRRSAVRANITTRLAVLMVIGVIALTRSIKTFRHAGMANDNIKTASTNFRHVSGGHQELQQHNKAEAGNKQPVTGEGAHGHGLPPFFYTGNLRILYKA